MPALPAGPLMPQKLPQVAFRVGERQFLFLLAWVAAVTLISFTFLSQDFPLRRATSEALPLDISKISFPEPVYRTRFIDNLDSALKEQDKNKQYELFERLFLDVLSFYSISRDPATKNQAELLASYIKNTFPDQTKVKGQTYMIDCLDNVCGSANYPEAITQIRQELDSLEIDPKIRKTIYLNLENAATVGDREKEWGYYYSAFGMVRQFYLSQKGEKTKQIAQDFRKFLQDNYPEQYGLLERNLPESLEI